MALYTVITIIICLASLFAFIIVKYTKLPLTIGIMILTIAVSLVLVILNRWLGAFSTTGIKEAIEALDFHDLLLNRMLGFLLFAGAIHIDARNLKKQSLPIIALATVGTIISTTLVAVFTFLLFILFHFDVPFIYCLLFGALISPTDPIAVLGILKLIKIPASLEMKISGESLFNDGVALVIFTVLYEIALSGTSGITVSGITLLFIQEAGGGLLFGMALGYAGYFITKQINHYSVEVMITVAIVMGGYELASYLHISGALAMVTAGIITGNQLKNKAASATTQDYLNKFWELLDDILNVVLFMLIGLEMLIIPVSGLIIGLGVIAIGIVLAARYISVAISVILFKKIVSFEKNVVLILTWGGLRGGLSVAMALSLTDSMYKNQFLLITYIIVIFSIVVQGLTIGKVARKLAC